MLRLPFSSRRSQPASARARVPRRDSSCRRWRRTPPTVSRASCRPWCRCRGRRAPRGAARATWNQRRAHMRRSCAGGQGGGQGGEGRGQQHRALARDVAGLLGQGVSRMPKSALCPAHTAHTFPHMVTPASGRTRTARRKIEIRRSRRPSRRSPPPTRPAHRLAKSNPRSRRRRRGRRRWRGRTWRPSRRRQ